MLLFPVMLNLRQGHKSCYELIKLEKGCHYAQFEKRPIIINFKTTSLFYASQKASKFSQWTCNTTNRDIIGSNLGQATPVLLGEGCI